MNCSKIATRVWCVAAAVSLLGQVAGGQEADTSKLREIEGRLMPACLQDGPARFATLPDYYWAENEALKTRFQRAKSAYVQNKSQPFHAMTLVAGAAGVGKTFIKGETFNKAQAAGAVCKFDIKELYVEWLESKQTVQKPDLFSGKVVLNELPAARDSAKPLLLEYLAEKQPAFVIVDSLDEIHPDDYVSVLSQLEQYAFDGSRQFAHVVVFARPLAFVDYWKQRTERPEADIKLMELHAPVFKTTGDLMVSSWNYHAWRYQLAWTPEGSEAVGMPLEAYQQWAAQGFAKRGPFQTVTYKQNQNISPQVHATLERWAKTHCRVSGMLTNLAGNGMLREIAEDFALAEREYDETQVFQAYFAAWLARDAKSDDRPDGNDQHLDLYLRLLEAVALKYFPRLDADGYFPVDAKDTVTVTHEGQSLAFSVQRILDRSGLKQIALPLGNETRYRFEPIWLHRLLIEQHRARKAPNRVTAAVPPKVD